MILTIKDTTGYSVGDLVQMRTRRGQKENLIITAVLGRKQIEATKIQGNRKERRARRKTGAS